MLERTEDWGAVGEEWADGSGSGAGGASSRADLWEAFRTGAPHLEQFCNPGASSASQLGHVVMGRILVATIWHAETVTNGIQTRQMSLVAAAN